jgi:tetratricopeptide (TPR) repeat protein
VGGVGACTYRDPEKTGKVDFEAFRKWWRLKEDTSRREMRKNVAELFHMMDADGNGTLDRTEIGLVAEKIASKYSGAEFDPPFDLATDYAAMDTHGRGHVTYDEFAAWFKVRSGDDEPEVPVLPEYMVTKVKDLTADGEGLGDRSGKELWKFLRLRLKVLVKLQNQWGRVQDLYGTGGNLFESHTIPDGLYDPDSLFMKYWDVFQFFALTYIILIIPVRVGFAVEVPLLSFPFILDAIIDIYFIVDIYLNFNTAMWLPNGVLETNRKKIRRAYLRGWFTIDIISTAPLTYMLLIGRLMDGDTRGERNGYQRMLRLAKIVRFKRIRAVLKKYEDNGVIGDVTPYLGSMGTIATIIISGHFLACLWFHAGMRHGSIDCDPEHEYADILGRIGDTDCVPDGDGGHHFPVAGWVLRQDYPEATSLGTKYIDSVYSVFKSKFAYTGNEMRVGILSELVLGLIFGSLAGVISAIMMTLGAGQQDAMLKLLELRAWMRARDLKVSDKVKILAAFNTQNELAAFNQKQILGELPPSLAADISYYMYGKYIERIPLFRHLGKEVIAETCKWVKDVSLAREQVVYQEGKYGTEMYFIVNGEVEVSFDGERLGFLGEGAFFGEAPLINSISGAGGNGSNIRTRTVRTLCTCELGVVREEDVLNIMARYPELRIRLSNFNLVGKNFSAKGRRKAEWNTLKSEVIGPLGGKPDGQLPTLLPPLQEKPGFDPAMAARMQAALEEEKARGAADRARAAKEAATLRGVVETLRESLAAAAGAAAAAAAPSAAPSAVSSTAQAPRPLRPDEEEVVVEVTEGRMAKGIKTAFLPSEGHFRTVDQAAAAVLRAQSQVMKAQADLLRACAYSPAAADAALKVQTDAALSETILASLLAGMNESTEAPTVESLQAKANLANVMGDMADPAAAQPVYREVVSAQTAALGPDHLETLQTKHNQAIAMKKSGDHAGARRLLEEVIEGLTEQLGATHAKTIESKCDLAAVLRVTGEQTQARHLYEEAIEARSAELGPKHAATLTARFNLASLLDQMNEREIARDMYEEVIEGQTETLGPQHTETLDTMYNLADLLESRRFKDFSRVRELFVAVAAGYQEAHGPDHAETLDAEERLRRANFRLKAKRNAAVHAVAAVSRAQSAMGGLFDEGGARPSSADL